MTDDCIVCLETFDNRLLIRDGSCTAGICKQCFDRLETNRCPSCQLCYPRKLTTNGREPPHPMIEAYQAILRGLQSESSGQEYHEYSEQNNRYVRGVEVGVWGLEDWIHETKRTPKFEKLKKYFNVSVEALLKDRIIEEYLDQKTPKWILHSNPPLRFRKSALS